MVDRVLHMIRSFSPEGYTPELLEAATLRLQEEGYPAALAYLAGTGLSADEAARLLGRIEREDVRLNREVFAFHAIIFLIFALVLYYSLDSGSYLFALIPGFFLVRAGLRIYRFLRAHRLSVGKR